MDMSIQITVGTGIIVINNSNEVLLVKDKKAKRGGKENKWGIIGGVLEPNLSFEDNAIKEALEETGYIIELIGLVKIYQHVCDEYNRISVIFRAIPIKIVNNVKEDEISEIRWFKYDEIPWTDLRFSHNQEMIRDAYNSVEHSIDIINMQYINK